MAPAVPAAARARIPRLANTQPYTAAAAGPSGTRGDTGDAPAAPGAVTKRITGLREQVLRCHLKPCAQH